MRSSIALLPWLCAATLAWAGDPPPSATAAPAPAPASSAAPADTAKPAADQPSKAPANATVLVTAEQEKKWRSQGYKPEKRGGETFWCRREATIGSRFEDKKCWTAAALEDNERNSQGYVEERQHTSTPGGR